MAEENELMIFTPEQGVSIQSALEVLRRQGVGELQSLGEVGLILGTAPTSLIGNLRALPEFRAVDFDYPVHITPKSAD
ncbi:MAG TPA: hypothetical protein VGA34_05505 [Alteraurantiacibacter sp.]|jgi:hypothetical protein